jgi:hypothetical protein
LEEALMTESAIHARAHRFGGAVSIVLAVLTALAAILYVLLPAAQRLGVPGRELLPSFAANPLPLQLESLALAGMGVVGLAVVRPIRKLVRSDDAWLRWASNLALVGFAVAAVGNTLIMGKLPGIAAAYVAAEPAAQSTIVVFWRTTLDPFGLWQFGAVGVWLLVVGILALRTAHFPSLGAWLALAAGVAHISIPVVLLVSAQSALAVLALVAAAVIVVWFAWVGLYMWRAGAAAV